MKINSPCISNIRPISDTLEVVGGKWKLLILSALAGSENLRFNELQRQLGNITPRVLSKELKELESHELISRKAHDTMPITVEYKLTEYGHSLEIVMAALRDWGIQHRKRFITEDQQKV